MDKQALPKLTPGTKNIMLWREKAIARAVDEFRFFGDYLASNQDIPPEHLMEFSQSLTAQQRAVYSGEHVDHLMLMQLKNDNDSHHVRRTYILEYRLRFTNWLVDLLSDASIDLLKADNTFLTLKENRDFIGIWRMILRVHTQRGAIASPEERERQIEILKELRMGNSTIHQYITNFNTERLACATLGCIIEERTYSILFIKGLNVKRYHLDKFAKPLLDNQLSEDVAIFPNTCPAIQELARKHVDSFVSFNRTYGLSEPSAPDTRPSIPDPGTMATAAATPQQGKQSCWCCFYGHEGGSANCLRFACYLHHHPELLGDVNKWLHENKSVAKEFTQTPVQVAADIRKANPRGRGAGRGRGRNNPRGGGNGSRGHGRGRGRDGRGRGRGQGDSTNDNGKRTAAAANFDEALSDWKRQITGVDSQDS